MKIKMLKTIPGSIDGVTVIELQAGTEYTMTDAARGQRRAAAYTCFCVVPSSRVPLAMRAYSTPVLARSCCDVLAMRFTAS